MKLRVFLSSFAGCGALLIAGGHAQQDAPAEPAETDEAAVVQENARAATETDEGGQNVIEVNPDEMADQLNSQQQLQQTFTLERTIDGKVVQSEKRTVVYDRSTPYRETEAGQTTIEALKSAFDGELLTRTEAFEEAKLDFTVADANRDGMMTQSEFANLVESWRLSPTRNAAAPDKETARQRQYDAFLAEIDPDAANIQFDAYAAEKFKFMAGAAETVSRSDYIREYLLDFDSMDQDKDTLLKGDELLRFRALNRGETIEM